MTYAAARVRPNSEFDLLERLEASGHEGYCPVSVSLSRPAGKRSVVEVRKPAWPGYLLVRHDTIRFDDEVYRDPRFHGFLGFQDELSVVSEEWVEVYRDREARGMCNPESKGVPEFLQGEVYKVLSGPWQSMVGEVVDSQKGRVRLNGYDFNMVVSIDGLLLRRHCVESSP